MTDPLHVGFTGSSECITARQRSSLVTTFEALYDAHPGQRLTLHHGDCIEGDALAHTLAKRLGWRIEIHPPINPRKRAWCQDADVIHEPRDYMDRNLDIAHAASVLVAAPDELDEVMRSGTWSTVRRARLYGRRVLIVQPDGAVREEEVRAPGVLL